MLSFLALVYLGLIYIRPGELFVAWQAVPAVQISAVLAMIGLAVSMVVRQRLPLSTGQDWFLVMFCGAVVLSSVANGWVGGAYLGMSEFAPAMFLYVLVKWSFDSRKSIRIATIVWLLLNVVLAISGIVQHATGTGLGGVTMIDGRIRATGIFNDPNDLGLSLVMVLPFALSEVLDKDLGFWRRVFGLGATGVLLWAVYLTNSRGSALGTALVIGVLVVQRFGKAKGLVPVVVLLCALLAMAPSRLAAGDESADESSAGRIEAWYAGLEMFKASPLWGVGWGKFLDFHHLVAHNSFVHTFAELGGLGIFTFLGFIILGLQQVRRRDDKEENDPLRRQLFASLLGTLACIFFLSRQYVVYLYVPFALAAAYGRLTGVTFRGKDLVLIVTSVPAMLVVIYLAIRVLGA